jgi:uncharacterized protein (DUF1697 family)
MPKSKKRAPDERTQAQSFIALLRGINVTGRNQIPMAELRSLCTRLGWSDVQSYIQSGNLLFSTHGDPAKLEAELESAIALRFGHSISVIIRRATDWPAFVQGNPFPAASLGEPNRVMLALAKAPPKADAVENLMNRASGGEEVVRVGDALWLYYRSGVGRSKLSPALLDRLVGSPVTARNWRTVLKINE